MSNTYKELLKALPTFKETLRPLEISKVYNHKFLFDENKHETKSAWFNPEFISSMESVTTNLKDKSIFFTTDTTIFDIIKPTVNRIGIDSQLKKTNISPTFLVGVSPTNIVYYVIISSAHSNEYYEVSRLPTIEVPVTETERITEVLRGKVEKQNPSLKKVQQTTWVKVVSLGLFS